MKTAIIVHGWDGSPSEPALQWLKAELEKRDYDVKVPEMPNTSEPEIGAWVRKLKEVTDNSVPNLVFGHSIGCQAALRYLETLPADSKVEKLILVAPWMQLDMNTIREEGEEVVEIARPWMETPIDFEKVRHVAGKTVAIFSDNDPYVPLDQKDLFEDELNAETVIEHDKKHYNIGAGITELPVVLKYI